eukprot:CAMPEP_0174313364 /NCGR_PEP_ID=MMETSP0810-20121108/4925_1 /TAXON_ID=73025 ORGANISM="Eutreptiella gymnastica-like, Strain CCMP1594" /NCGR_SAMPLE_ID=MMETSP0810 /ASSEMBLY_ACC=CAM_ASM_000659 /LENGTH=46 /DNA_ID= /DNA_START= /DNA_END= /DNA_ORIENTATION=
MAPRPDGRRTPHHHIPPIADQVPWSFTLAPKGLQRQWSAVSHKHDM